MSISPPKPIVSAQRTVQLLTLVGLLSACAYSQPSSLISNAYYGDSNGTTLLSALIASGATTHLTHLTYAFATSDGNSNPCTGAPTAMNIADLRALKAQNPNLKILISVGGASAYQVFVNAMPNSTAITNFANACVNTLMGSFIGYVDGIDIDWEFPQNTTDEQNFNLLLGAFRTALNTYATQNNISEHLLLTAAIGPESTQYGWEFIDFSGQTYSPAANNSVDFYNVEFYNYAYNSDPITQSNAPITAINNDIFGNAQAYGAAGLVPVGKVPVAKIVVGIPFYGDHYTGVSNGAVIGGPGMLDDPSSPSGTPTYAQIAAMIAANPGLYQNFSDSDGSAWTWESSTGDWWEYDNAGTIGQKIQYAQTKQLAGVFAWNLQQDTTSGTLLDAMPAPSAGYHDVTSSVRVTSTGFIYNRVKKQGTATMTIKNIGGAGISGPIQLVLSGLPAGSTAANAAGTFNGNPYWTASAGSLAPGSSVTVAVTFSYAVGLSFNSTPTVYSGNF